MAAAKKATAKKATAKKATAKKTKHTKKARRKRGRTPSAQFSPPISRPTPTAAVRLQEMKTVWQRLKDADVVSDSEPQPRPTAPSQVAKHGVQILLEDDEVTVIKRSGSSQSSVGIDPTKLSKYGGPGIANLIKYGGFKPGTLSKYGGFNLANLVKYGGFSLADLMKYGVNPTKLTKYGLALSKYGLALSKYGVPMQKTKTDEKVVAIQIRNCGQVMVHTGDQAKQVADSALKRWNKLL